MAFSEKESGEEKSLRGRIVRGIGGFYYVYTESEGMIECRPRGIFRKEGIKPLPGDEVEITITDEKDREGSLDEICPRKNMLIRPACANVDQALVVFAAASPDPHLNLLDRFLVQMHRWHLPVIIGLNKTDLVSQTQLDAFTESYKHSGCQVILFSVNAGEGLTALRQALEGKTTVVAGPSGVGKSSLTNLLNPQAGMQVGEISRKIGRGRNTTRHTELIPIGRNTFFMDTPGFTSLNVTQIPSEELKQEFPEFAPYESECAFLDCMHMHEPDCGVKSALARGEIPQSRYDSYLQILQELKDKERRK